MNWILDHFQIFVVIALVFASWVKRRMDVATAEREARRDTGQAEGAEDVFGPEAGWPPVIPPGPPPLVRQGPPPLVRQVVLPVRLAAQSDETAILKRQQEMQDQLRRIKESKATTTGGAAATRSRVSAAQRHVQTVQNSAQTGLRGSLRKPKEIRRAIVMREILGPPLGLR